MSDDRIRELQEALDQVAAQVTEEYLVPALREAGIENPERYALRYVLAEPESSMHPYGAPEAPDEP